MQKFGYGIWKTKCTVMDAANTIWNIDVKLTVLCGSVADLDTDCIAWIHTDLVVLDPDPYWDGNADSDSDQEHGNRTILTNKPGFKLLTYLHRYVFAVLCLYTALRLFAGQWNCRQLVWTGGSGS